MKKLQILTTTAVIGLASAGMPALAQEANTDVDTTTSVNESALVEKPTIEKSSDVKPSLDAQKKVVEQTKEQLTVAQAKADEANKQVSNAQADVAKATQAVKHAEEVASKATPQNIEANNADQKANLADQEANANETATTDAKIATQTEAVNNAKTDVANAEQALKDANVDVSAKEAQVQSAKDAISGTGLAQAEDKLDEAKAETKGAEKNVTNAETALTDANKADQKRQEAIDTAQADVDAKTTSVNKTKDNLASATQKANDATSTFTQAKDKLDKATKALDSIDIVKIPDLTQFKKAIASGSDELMTSTGATIWENSKSESLISEKSKNEPVDLDNLTDAQKEEISHLYIQGLKEIREQLKDNGKYSVTSKENTGTTKEAISLATERAKAYKERGQSPVTHGHIGLGVENLAGLGPKEYFNNMYDLKKAVVDSLLHTSFGDAPSKWGHLKANLDFSSKVGLDVANINGYYWLVIAFSNKGTDLVNPKDAEAIQKAYDDAKAEKAKAQTASEKANDALKQASADYASALELKTSAEKTLADATATPIQTQVAENNLRLAKLALESAQKRQAEAQKAVDNFSADLASKKQALDNAKLALESAKHVQEQKVQSLADAKTELKTQESKLETLKAQKAKLVEEKDRLVEEAKALAEELKAYVEAPINLAKAKTTLAEKQDALKTAQAKAETAKAQVDAIQATLDVEQAKLDELQDKFDKLQDLEEKAKDNLIATLPDGTIVAIPNGAPIADELPEFDINSLNRELDDNKTVTIDDRGNVTVNGQAYTSQQQVSSKPIYSRVERAKTLPETGEHESWLAIIGVTILSVVCAVGSRKKN
ncbi:MAG: SEC10/PgrA surface exclusion domain-containing protein [Peptoanaerobacter stomatis]